MQMSRPMFAESEKKSDPDKRGRFNLGAKLAMLMWDEPKILETILTGGKEC